jgi:hypothetical protein
MAQSGAPFHRESEAWGQRRVVQQCGEHRHAGPVRERIRRPNTAGKGQQPQEPKDAPSDDGHANPMQRFIGCVAVAVAVIVEPLSGGTHGL